MQIKLCRYRNPQTERDLKSIGIEECPIISHHISWRPSVTSLIRWHHYLDSSPGI